MDAKMKEDLLNRKFSSLEYMEEMSEFHKRSLEAMIKALEYFYAHPPAEDWHTWHRSDWPETWEERALRNFSGMQASIEKGILQFKNTQELTSIEGTAGDLHGIFRDLDNIGFKWWDYVPKTLKDEFHNSLVNARDIASNIWRTVGEYWKPGSILKESVTGPIDEEELLKYLKPGETA
jgi:hypothetical protein